MSTTERMSATELRAAADARVRRLLDRLVLAAGSGTLVVQILAARVGAETLLAIAMTLLGVAAAAIGVAKRVTWTPHVYLGVFFGAVVVVMITNGPLIQLGALSLAGVTLAFLYLPRRLRRLVIVMFSIAPLAVGLLVTTLDGASPPVIVLAARHTWGIAFFVCAFSFISTAFVIDAAIRSRSEAQRHLARALDEERAARCEREKLDGDIANAHRVDLIVSLAADVGKDIGAALATISERARMLSAQLERDDARACLADVIAVAATAGSTMQSLTALDAELARPESGADASRALHDLPRVVRRVLPTGVKLTISADPSSPTWTQLTSTNLLRVVNNLVINARDALGETGSIGVSVTATPTHVHIEVVDDGEGMDAETRARVFEPFFTTKPIGRGSGLGLTTARALVERAGGSMTIDSAPGQGTRVGLLLPRIAPSPPA